MNLQIYSFELMKHLITSLIGNIGDKFRASGTGNFLLFLHVFNGLTFKAFTFTHL